MTLSRTLIRVRPFFLFLLPVFFVLHAYQFYYGFVPVTDLLIIACSYLAVTAVLFLVVQLFTRSSIKTGILCFLLMIIVLYWGDMLLQVKVFFPHAFFARIPVLFVTVMGAAALLYFLFTRLQISTQKRIILLLNVLFLIYLGIDAGIIISKSGTDHSMSRVLPEKLHVSNAKNWNVYFLLFDEYASSYSLQHDLGFDNSDIDSFLVQKGFSIQHHSRSNYNYTYFSMASVLQMSYLEKIKKPRSVDLRDYNVCAGWIRNNQAVQTLQHAGYDFYNYTFFEIAGRQPIINDGFLTVKSRLITANTLYDRFMHDYMQFFRSAATNEKETAATYFKFDDYNNGIVSRVQRIVDSPLVHPRFVYAHFAVPHSPFYYNAAGERLRADSAIAASVAVNPQYYWYNVQRANKDIRDVVTAILAKESGHAVIVIMGDHGFRGKTKSNDPQAKFRNMNAVYFPDHDYNTLYDSVSNVNMFRILLSKVTGNSYSLLPDSSVTLHDKGAGYDN
ncbi:hypothetical protein ACTHGU_13785 [Chitinophagaceae bacterium MMS25-I14]